MERFVFRPWGMAGGKPGEKARVVVNHGTPQERELGKLDIFYPDPGDVVTIMTPGGGGYGDPLNRPPLAVLEDVVFGYITEDMARSDYGVVLSDGRIDAAATEDARVRIRAERGVLAAFDFGPERRAWEAVFDDARMSDLNRLLMRLSPSRRYARRRAIFEAVVPRLSEAGVVPLETAIGDPAMARSRFETELGKLDADCARASSDTETAT